jgi:hypothetical protein
MAAEQPQDPRSHPISYDVGSPRQPELPPASHHVEPDRVLQRLDRAEHRIEMLESNLAMLASAISPEGIR